MSNAAAVSTGNESARNEGSPRPQTAVEQQTRCLLSAARQGDQSARSELVRLHSRLVYAMQRRFIRCGRDADDLFQVGCIGLLKAIDRFDPDYGVCFSTYAVPLILGEMRRLLRDDTPLSVARSLWERAILLEKLRRELYQQWSAEPELWQLAEACDLSVEQAVEALEAIRPPLSINESRYNSDYHGRTTRLSDSEQMADRQAEFDEKLTGRLTLQDELDKLPPRQAAILRGRYFAGMTQAELGQQLHVSQVQISRLEKQALTALRQSMCSSDNI